MRLYSSWSVLVPRILFSIFVVAGISAIQLIEHISDGCELRARRSTAELVIYSDFDCDNVVSRTSTFIDPYMLITANQVCRTLMPHSRQKTPVFFRSANSSCSLHTQIGSPGTKLQWPVSRLKKSVDVPLHIKCENENDPCWDFMKSVDDERASPLSLLKTTQNESCLQETFVEKAGRLYTKFDPSIVGVKVERGFKCEVNRGLEHWTLSDGSFPLRPIGQNLTASCTRIESPSRPPTPTPSLPISTPSVPSLPPSTTPSLPNSTSSSLHPHVPTPITSQIMPPSLPVSAIPMNSYFTAASGSTATGGWPSNYVLPPPGSYLFYSSPPSTYQASANFGSNNVPVQSVASPPPYYYPSWHGNRM